MKLNLPKLNRTWMMLLGAIGLGLLAMFLTVQYLRLQESSLRRQIEEKARGKGPLVEVVVPTQDLAAGTAIDASMVASRPVASDLVYDDAIAVNQFDAFKGQALLKAVKRGRPLLKSDLRPIYADFAGTLKPGSRAMTVEVDDLNAISHMVQPGNLIDLMLVLENTGPASRPPQQHMGPASQGDGKVVVPFMQAVKVLATGQKVVHDAPTDGAPNQGRSAYSNFTLEVTPSQAARVALALELGKLRATLRNESDSKAIEHDPVSARNFLLDIAEQTRMQERVAKAAAKRRAASEQYPVDEDYVEYIVGGKNSGSGVSTGLSVALPPALANLGVGTTPAAAAPATTASAPFIPYAPPASPVNSK
ncbi:Flp pilus assembly protein CpaB [Chitinimonas sp.]|uniref:Flp pilus assembly protein CpaB n=1 Tax=Chitinimonas sp. TaxID=1934313 RepID=UPI0035AFD197